MKKYVEKRSCLTCLKEASESIGCETFRTRTSCGCSHNNNRNAVIIADKEGVIKLRAIRCRQCAKGGSND